jgi:cysteine synthase A
MNYISDISGLIGNTPLVKIDGFCEKMGVKANLFAKLEMFNNAGSSKDRVALKMILDAEEAGLLDKDTVVIEPTSGNTGIGICSVCAAKGYKAVIVMPESMSLERKMLMKAYGAELVLTPASLGMKGAIEKAKELSKSYKKSLIPSQFSNPSNPRAHYDSTGPEIYSALDGKIDAFVAGVGTGGTVTGVGRFLKEKNKNIFVCGAEPEDSPFLTEGRSGAHLIQGIGAGFKPEVLDLSCVDRILTVNSQRAYEASRQLVKTQGIFVGISSGAALCAAIDLAKSEGFKNICVLLPDSGERYMSCEGFI